MSTSKVLGIDIGGSHITAALVDVHTKKIVPESYVRRAVNAAAPAGEIIREWTEVFSQSMAAARVTGVKIGIAMPGPFDYEKGISFMKGQDKYEALYGLSIKSLLAAELGMFEGNIRMMNDASCYLNGEMIAGAAFGYHRSIGITLGTGLGSAWNENGEITDADLWHSPFKDGIAEDYLSTRWFIRYFRELGGGMVRDVKHLAELTPANETAVKVFAEFGRNLGHFMAGLIQSKKPGVVVLGGNIAKAGSLFMKQAEGVLSDRSIKTPVKMAKLGEHAALYGAAGLWRKDLYAGGNQVSAGNVGAYSKTPE
ncbi:ROK family protein [Hufsiella ginkgonis]|uniref:ROK family protein n=1 Tax=Hufsiella ginkgonis TaxID=2695274 RepID=A0A7K1XT25_9SPHI|nr:ROK family protein [Hufsiella ginkgonis]MXV14104.1 ROK family protein [Hufsiella ginkgonis]